jgi:hypothetical protein
VAAFQNLEAAIVVIGRFQINCHAKIKIFGSCRENRRVPMQGLLRADFVEQGGVEAGRRAEQRIERSEQSMIAREKPCKIGKGIMQVDDARIMAVRVPARREERIICLLKATEGGNHRLAGLGRDRSPEDRISLVNNLRRAGGNLGVDVESADQRGGIRLQESSKHLSPCSSF